MADNSPRKAGHKEESREVVRTGYDERMGQHFVEYADGRRVVAMSYSDYIDLYSKQPTKLDVDVSEALTGLKAVTREAREATRAIKALESDSGRISVDGDANKYRDVRASGLYLGTTNGSVYLRSDKVAVGRAPTWMLVEELEKRQEELDAERSKFSANGWFLGSDGCREGNTDE